LLGMSSPNTVPETGTPVRNAGPQVSIPEKIIS
jgi:hypothetical protein